jgi:serine protease DegS
VFKVFISTIKAILYGLLIGAIIVIAIPNTRGAVLDSVKEWLAIHNAPVSYSYAIKRSAPAVVNISSITQRRNPLNEIERRRQGLGSGVIMSSNGIILTNLHVIKGADIIYVALQDGRKGIASIVGTDPLTDLAVLHIQAEDLPVIPFNLDNPSQVGDLVLAIGNPYNLGQTITQGIISATDRRPGLRSSSFLDLLQTDAAINDGNSGGALINSRGELVGINSASFNSISNESSNGISFAIPVQLAYSILKEIVVEGHVSRGSLGFEAEPFNSDIDKLSLSLDADAVNVTKVNPNSPAGRVGLQEKDVIVAINKKPFKHINELRNIIAKTKANNDIELTIIRNGKQLDLLMKTEELRFR